MAFAVGCCVQACFWFGLAHAFSKCAVRVGKERISKVDEFKGSLFARMDGKAFEVMEVAEVEAWLEGYRNPIPRLSAKLYSTLPPV